MGINQLKKSTRIISLLLCILLLFQQSGFSQVTGQLDISGRLLSLHNSLSPDVFKPLHLRYLSYNFKENNFKLFLDKEGVKNSKPQEIESATKTLLNYFFTGLTFPNDKFWVNLRPDAEDNIIDNQIAKTDIGRIMLESELQLKKDIPAYTSTKTPEGKKYWNKI